MPPLILVVEDETILGDSICTYLEHHGYVTAVARSGEDGVRLAEENSPDVAIVDIRLPGLDGLSVLRKLRDVSAGTEVVMMTAHASVGSAVEAMKGGAFDYLTKPLDLDEVRVVVDKALAHQRMRRELTYLKAREETGGHTAEILGESPAIRLLRQQIERIAALESPEGGAPTVLVRGETGAGKEMVARAIHYGSPRAKGPFVEINCAAIPSSLLEAELFGYEKGAYTDARTAKPGLFEAADGGTLFLDEIGHMEVGLAGEALEGHRGEVGPPRGRPAAENVQCPDRGGDQPGPGGGHRRGGLPARPLLPDQGPHLGDPAPPVARERHRASGQAFPGAFHPAVRPAPQTLGSGGGGVAPDLRVARQRSGVGASDGAGDSASRRVQRLPRSTSASQGARRRRRCRSAPRGSGWISRLGGFSWKMWSASSSSKRCGPRRGIGGGRRSLLGISKETLRYRTEKHQLQPPA